MAGKGIPFAGAVELAKCKGESELEAIFGIAQFIGAAPDEDESWRFQTRAIGHDELSMQVGIDLARAFVFPVRKQRTTFFANTILLGRAASSDVCIEHSSISKLHARIRQLADGTWAIADAGSRNQTRIGQRVIGAQEEPLPFGSRIQLGMWTLRFERLAETLSLLRKA